MRIREAKKFRGIEEMKLGIPIPRRLAFEFKRISWILAHSGRLVTSPVRRIVPRSRPSSKEPGTWQTIIEFVLAAFIPATYILTPKEFKTPCSPPLGRYVVVGIFEDSGTLLEEVIIYTGGHSISKQLVRERRRLFSLPILRDIKAFELYKASKTSISVEYRFIY